MAYLVLKPDLCIPAARRGLLLWAGTVLPALLPFFFLTSLLSSAGIAESLSRGADRPMNVLFRQSGVSFFVFLTSILSGYPIGAKMTAELCKKGILSRSEGTRTACLCSTSGPLFVIGSVGTALFGDKRIGVAIYVSHLLAALGCGTVACRLFILGLASRACRFLALLSGRTADSAPAVLGMEHL